MTSPTHDPDTSATRRVAISGATGLIGRALAQRLGARGVTVQRLVRGDRRQPGDIRWDPAGGTIDSAALEGVDAVVHLAGEPIAERWTDSARVRIRESRVRGTETIARAVAELARRPRVLVSASAVGYYGSDHGDEWLDESSAAGSDFLARVCAEWESAARPAEEAGIRVVHPRTGLVLSAEGGVLARLLPLFRFGLGGKLGNGRQWMSWISLDDEVRALEALVDDDRMSGPVNLASPNPVTNADFTRELAKALHRPAPFAVPGFALRLALGEMGDVALLGGQRVRPQVLSDSGFIFRHATLAETLAELLR